MSQRPKAPRKHPKKTSPPPNGLWGPPNLYRPPRGRPTSRRRPQKLRGSLCCHPKWGQEKEVMGGPKARRTGVREELCDGGGGGLPRPNGGEFDPQKRGRTCCWSRRKKGCRGGRGGCAGENCREAWHPQELALHPSTRVLCPPPGLPVRGRQDAGWPMPPLPGPPHCCTPSLEPSIGTGGAGSACYRYISPRGCFGPPPLLHMRWKREASLP